MDTTFLTEAEAKCVKRGLNITLDTIIYDLLENCEPRRRSIRRAEVIEVVLDANYLELYGARSNDERAAVKKFRSLPYDQQNKFAATVFTEKSYSL